jgi:hypothetical protein
MILRKVFGVLYRFPKLCFWTDFPQSNFIQKKPAFDTGESFMEKAQIQVQTQCFVCIISAFDFFQFFSPIFQLVISETFKRKLLSNLTKLFLIAKV